MLNQFSVFFTAKHLATNNIDQEKKLLQFQANRKKPYSLEKEPFLQRKGANLLKRSLFP